MLLLLACIEPAAVDDFVAPDAPDHGVQLVVPVFDVPAYTELERCLFVDAPASGHIARIELVARPGLHHTSVARSPQDYPQGHEEACEIGIPEELMGDYDQVPEPLFASSTSVHHEDVAFPAGIAVPLLEGEQLVIDTHTLNATDQATQGEVYINLHFAEPQDVEHDAHLFTFSNVMNVRIPARSRHTLTTTCTFPDDAVLVTATPHMHQLGAGVQVWRNDGDQDVELLVDSPGWSAPDTVWFDPPVAVSAGDGLTWSCTWENPGSEPVHFGPTADDEMCTVFGYHAPADGLLWRADYDTDNCTVIDEVTEPLD
jgi:hypothetical protein